MKATELQVEGAYVFTPDVFRDERGFFVSPFQQSDLVETIGRPLFPVAQMSLSQSKRGVVRGIHYTRTPPGVAKYVHCPQGQALDIIIDLRVGSPTFGKWDSVVLDREEAKAVYIPLGMGHMFVALTDDTVVSYMLSGQYVADNELAITPFDPELDLPIPKDIEPLMSPRDTVAPTVAQALEQGLLPDYQLSRDLHDAL